MSIIRNTYMIQKHWIPSSPHSHLECVQHWIRDGTLAASRTWTTFSSSQRVDNNLVERGHPNPSQCQVTWFQRSYSEHTILRVLLFPFLLIRTLLFFRCFQLILSSQKCSSGYSKPEKQWSQGHSNIPYISET